MNHPGSFAERLKWARELVRQPGGKEVSQRRLAKIARLTPAHVGLLENGSVKRPDMNTASLLAAALGTTTDWLWSGLGSVPTPESVATAVAAASADIDPNDVADEVPADRERAIASQPATTATEAA